MDAGSKQQPGCVPPGQAARLDGVEPIQMVCDQACQLLTAAAGKRHVCGNSLRTSLNLLVCKHLDDPCDSIIHIGTHFDLCKFMQNNASLLNRNAEERRNLHSSHLCICGCGSLGSRPLLRTFERVFDRSSSYLRKRVTARRLPHVCGGASHLLRCLWRPLRYFRPQRVSSWIFSAIVR